MSNIQDVIIRKELKCQYCGKKIVKDPIIQVVWKNGKISLGHIYCSKECALADKI